MKKSRVFVVDYELVSPISIGRKSLIGALQNNITADRKLTRLDVEVLPFKSGAEISGELQSLYQAEPDAIQNLCRTDRKFELLVSAANLAQSRIETLCDSADPNRCQVILGIGADATPYELFETEISDLLRRKLNPIYEINVLLNKPGQIIHTINNPYEVYSHYLAGKFGFRGQFSSILTACVASTQAIAFGFDSIQRDQADVVLAGGTDSIINLLALISFGKLGVIVETKDAINCRPFDVNRSGTLAGEAAGFVCLVSEAYLIKNKLNPIAELTGYGNTLDGYKITAPDPAGIQMAKAMSGALKQAGWQPFTVDYIQAHGTGTRQNDATELGAIKQALGEHANQVAISATKDRHGHAIAAAGIQELCCLLAGMQHDFLPANLHLKQPINEEMNLLRENKKQSIKRALTCNFAFGGINTVLAVENMKV